MVREGGDVLSQGVLRGNSDGFADPRDFAGPREAQGEVRLAVLGDSFTAGRFVERNWPGRAERALAARGRSVRLLNLGVDGGGLGNWDSILRGYVEARRVELDGVVFAVTCDDLDRRFIWWDDTLAQSWTPPDASMAVAHKQTWELAADPFAGPREWQPRNPEWQGVTPAQLDDVLTGRWVPRVERPLRPYLLWRSRAVLGAALSPFVRVARAEPAGGEEAARGRVVADVRAVLAAHRWPALVLAFGTDPRRAEAFAKAIGADYVWANDLRFEPEDRIPYDGHWSQRGADKFGDHAAGLLDAWLARRPAAR
jgi:hypothetical protein